MASPLPAQADCRTPAAFCAWLAGTRNDLTAAAVATVPPVADVLNALSAAPGSLMARMSGSGATCFGLFPTERAAIQAAGWLASRCGDWWVCPTVCTRPRATNCPPGWSTRRNTVAVRVRY